MTWRRELAAQEHLIGRIKVIMYPNDTWSSVAMKIAFMLNKLKHEAQKYHPEMTEIERLKWMGDFDYDDMRDALLIDDDRPKPKRKSVGALLNVPDAIDVPERQNPVAASKINSDGEIK